MISLMVALFGLTADLASAQSGIKMNGTATLIEAPTGLWALHMEGTASHLGKFTCDGELALFPGQIDGTTEGIGVAAFTAANGDVLVAHVDYQVDADGVTQTHFKWQDSITYNDGRTVNSTGRFVDNRPAGLIQIGHMVCVKILIFTVCTIVVER
jgi:hypothetical protein